MKKSTEDWLVAFSFVLPGAMHYVNRDHKKGVALFSVAVLGLVLFLLPGEKVSFLGLVMLLGTYLINTLDVMFQPIFDSLKEIDKSLKGILVSLDGIAGKMEFMALELRRQNMILIEMNRNLSLLNSKKAQKFLPAPKQLLMLPSGRKPMLLPGTVEEKKEFKKSRVS